MGLYRYMKTYIQTRKGCIENCFPIINGSFLRKFGSTRRMIYIYIYIYTYILHYMTSFSRIFRMRALMHVRAKKSKASVFRSKE